MTSKKKSELPEWSPPIYGWQYALKWEDSPNNDNCWCESVLKSGVISINGYKAKQGTMENWSVYIDLGEFSQEFNDGSLDEACRQADEAIREAMTRLDSLR